MSRVPQGSVLIPALFNILINDLDYGVEYTLSKLVDDKRLGCLADSSEECAAIQRDLNRLERCVDKNLLKETRKSAEPCI